MTAPANKTTTAEVVKAWGVTGDPHGRLGVRGFRCFCPECGYLSNVMSHVGSARNHARAHRCEEEAQ